MRRTTTAGIVILSVLALGIAAAAVIAGVVESGRGSRMAATQSPTATGSLTREPRVKATPTREPRVGATFSAVSPAAQPSEPPTPEPIPAPMAEVPLAPTAVAPEVLETVLVSPPVLQQPAKEPIACPTGVVTSGLESVTVQNERHATSGGVTTVVDVAGRGNVHNGTTAAVKVSLYIPSVRGLDIQGRETQIYFTGDFDNNPPPGDPRPYEIAVGPGENAGYSFTAAGVRSADVEKTVAWYADPTYNVGDFADFDIYLSCPEVSVVPPEGGPSIPNTYVPWGS